MSSITLYSAIIIGSAYLGHTCYLFLLEVYSLCTTLGDDIIVWRVLSSVMNTGENLLSAEWVILRDHFQGLCRRSLSCLRPANITADLSLEPLIACLFYVSRGHVGDLESIRYAPPLRLFPSRGGFSLSRSAVPARPLCLRTRFLGTSGAADN